VEDAGELVEDRSMLVDWHVNQRVERGNRVERAVADRQSRHVALREVGVGSVLCGQRQLRAGEIHPGRSARVGQFAEDRRPLPAPRVEDARRLGDGVEKPVEGLHLAVAVRPRFGVHFRNPVVSAANNVFIDHRTDVPIRSCSMFP
jgi:hypothetical protein